MFYTYDRRRSHNRLLLYCLAGVVFILFINDPNKPRIVHFEKNDTIADHCVFYNFLSRSSKKIKEYEPITLALHSSINYADYLVKKADEWDDVISYAVYLFPGHDSGLEALAKLHKCHPLINQKVSIHLVWNRSFMDEPCANDYIRNAYKVVSGNSITCDDFYFEKENTTPLATYPINIMRNEARRGASTKLHLIGDMETRYSPSFAVKVRNLTQQLVNGDLGKAVLVYRRFEMDESEGFPSNLQTLQTLINKKKLIQFHVEYYKIGHFIPNLEQWLEYSLENKEVTYEYLKHAEWEPQFIMTHETPYHYEHAPTRSMDHQFLCYELCRAGYSYLVMSHVYNIHFGIKKQLSALEMSVGMYGLTQKDAVMARYALYINGRYPVNENAKCPHWDNYI